MGVTAEPTNVVVKYTKTDAKMLVGFLENPAGAPTAFLNQMIADINAAIAKVEAAEKPTEAPAASQEA
jgi:hypothetical protein